jgi:hypothetical protein
MSGLTVREVINALVQQCTSGGTATTDTPTNITQIVVKTEGFRRLIVETDGENPTTRMLRKEITELEDRLAEAA